MVYKFFDKKNSGGAIKNENMSKKLAKELHKPIIKKNQQNKSAITFYRQFLGC